jgi:hypothetical protein
MGVCRWWATLGSISPCSIEATLDHHSPSLLQSFPVAAFKQSFPVAAFGAFNEDFELHAGSLCPDESPYVRHIL